MVFIFISVGIMILSGRWLGLGRGAGVRLGLSGSRGWGLVGAEAGAWWKKGLGAGAWTGAGIMGWEQGLRLHAGTGNLQIAISTNHDHISLA